MTRPQLRRPTPLEVVATALPLLAVLAMLLTDARVDTDPRDGSPTPVALTSAMLVCPAGGDGGVLVASDAGAPGVVGVRSDEDDEEVEVAPDTVSRLPDATAVRATGALAPGLVAQRFAGPGLRAVDCPATSSDQWFTGVGAGAEHQSVLELHNPDGGPATATITVLGQSGEVGAGGNLRGVSVPGGGTVRLDLGAEIPKREELALHVTTDRGRLAATVVDGFVPVGRGSTTREYLPGQAEPSTSNLLLGLPGDRRLGDVDEPAVVVANTSDSVSRVALRLVTPQATFTPAEVEEVLVDPRSVRRFSISRLLGSEAAEGALGIEVVSSQPVTASFRGRVDGDLATVVPRVPVTSDTLVPVFFSGSRLVLGGATALGTVEVVAYDAAGREVERRTVEVSPETAVEVGVPGRAALLRVVPQGTPVQGSLVQSSPAGTAVVGLRELVREALVPDVRPGL